MIRPAAASDAAAIADIWNLAIRTTTITFNPVEKTGAEVGALITPDTPCLVFVDNGLVQGFARYSQFRGGDGYRFSVEHTIMLGAAAQGKGAGRDLMLAICCVAKDAGKHMIFAGVSAENHGAVAFHRKMGFTTAAVLPQVGYKFGRWLDLVLMQKRL
jgi:phosphinothricin acetyltransferase